jgi:hypothetical protein
MAQKHSCGHFSNLTIFEIERIREFAEKKNADVLDSHVSLLEKNIVDMGKSCELGDLSEETEHISNLKIGIQEKNWDKIKQESKSLEKNLILKVAKSHNDDEDPLSIIPSRIYESLG